ncbi:MAG: rhamnulokinase [Verrucomicrobia bacterium]|nr:rhamnulokinase [Verrucomicrobiota bacterium]
MKSASVYLAIDLGASNGRVMAGVFDGQRIELREMNRFPSNGVEVAGSTHWDVLQLFSDVLDGLSKAQALYGDRIAGIGVDTWGVDYALLDKTGKLLGNPFQYRDPRTDGIEERIHKIISREIIYKETGIQFMFFNTINQLFAEKESGTGSLETASHLVFLPDLFNYWLSGAIIQERSIASTSQLLNPLTGKWSDVLIDRLGLPEHLFGKITEPGELIGNLLAEVQEQTGMGSVPVFAVAGHDTGSAVAGAPLRDEAPAFLSSGTWSLMGIEARHPLIKPETMEASYSNEAGVEGTTRFLKNICGMWLVEQLKEEWFQEGNEFTYENLVDFAMEAEPFRSIIDPDHPSFARPGPMAGRIRDFCREHGQPIPVTQAQLLRTVFDSLACKYRIIFEQLGSFTSKRLSEMRVVGGGSKNHFLNQCTANALNCQVKAGPVEATSLGNVIMQMRGAGKIESLQAGRELVERSFSTYSYSPDNAKAWQEPVERLKQIIEAGNI